MISALQAEEMSLSIWLRPGGLTFAVYPKGVEPERGQPLSEGQYSYQPSHTPLERITDGLYREPLLTLPYQRVHIHYTPASPSLVPAALYSEEQAEAWTVTTTSGPSERLLSFALREEDKVLLGSMNRQICDFLDRTYLRPDYRPAYAAELGRLRELAREQRGAELLVWLTMRGLTLAYISPSGIEYINAFDYVRPEDERTHLGEVVYYLSLVYQTLGLSPTVPITLGGEECAGSSGYTEQNRLIASLRHELAGRFVLHS